MINLMHLAETEKLPDAVIRAGIRKQLKQRLEKETAENPEKQLKALYQFAASLAHQPVAVATDTANEQHYELPSAFFETFMGGRLKYSCGLWPEGITELTESEEAMLKLTCERAGLNDGMDILELGCGWGSLSLWMAENYPNARITVVSNSNTQRAFIEARGFKNLKVITADMNDFQTEQTFDRVVSVEMFEHMRNWPELMRRISGWLKPDGRLFVHIFVHRELAYLFREEGDESWMTKHFFKEGMMPAEHLFHVLNDDLLVEKHWRVNGEHYGKTLRAWLDKADANRTEAIALLEQHHSPEEAAMRFGRWRIFFMACEELFNWNGGDEWYIAHYLLKQR